MKTYFLKPLILSICYLYMHISTAQQLEVSATFLNKEEKSVQAYYTLLSEDSILKEGSDKKIKLNLKLNQEYTLIISKIGYQNKVIHFSTFANTSEKYKFKFEAILLECAKNKKTSGTNDHSTNIMIYFDQQKESFNYFNIDQNRAKYLSLSHNANSFYSINH